MKQSVVTLESKLTASLASITSQLSNCSATLQLQPPDTNVNELMPNRKQPSYAQIAAKDIECTVRQAVADSWKQQEQQTRSKSMLAIYGMQENGHDLNDLRQLAAILNCNTCRIISCLRIGRQSTVNEKPRILKVFLHSAEDCNMLLTNAKHLKSFKDHSNTYIQKWMLQEELDMLKSTREQCVTLNKHAPVMANGKKTFVVISGRLMQRTSDDKLQPAKAINHHATSSAPQSKNGAVGSQRAP